MGPGMMRMLPVMAALDADGDGEISASEIDGAVSALRKLDKNEDGKLTPDELRPEMGGPGGPGGPGDPMAFIEGLMRFDENKDGKLSKDELPERMQEMLDAWDADKDGALSKDELRRIADDRASRGGPGGGRGQGGRGQGRRGGGGGRPQRPE